MKFGTGYLPDPTDDRDRNISDLLSAAPPAGPKIDLEQFLPGAYNQRSTSSCVGQSGSGAIYTRAGAMGHKDRRIPSASWLYDIGRMTHGAMRKDSGTYIRGMCKAARQFGICPEESMPFRVGKINEYPRPKHFRDAYDQRSVSGYYRIYDSGQDRLKAIKTALDRGYPVVYGLRIDENWYDYSAGEVLGVPDVSIGGHATFLYGYSEADGGIFLGQNSWGTSWGDNGRYRIKQDAVAGSHARDIWAIDTVPEDSGT